MSDAVKRQITRAYVIDPARDREGREDIFIADGRIVGRGEAPAGFRADEVIDADGLILCPGLVDLRAQLREPGDGMHGDLGSELQAAVAGGVTSVVCTPDTEPVADQPNVIQDQLSRAKHLGLARVHPLGALTVGLAGKRLAEMGMLRAAGAIALANGNRAVADSQILRSALEYAASLDIPVFLHSEDPGLSRGDIHEGEVSTRLGLPGQPAAAERIGLARDLILAELSGVRAHIQHLSCAEAVAQFDEARKRPLPVTADVSIHHLHLTHLDIGYFNVHAKTTPPLRTQRDRDALRRALAAGTLSAIASDHTPWHEDTGRDTFHHAPPGISALETLLPLVLRLVDENVLSLRQALAKVTTGPARVLGLPLGTLDIGAPADLCLFDPEARFPVRAERFHSRGRNTPYNGWDLRGQVRYTLVDGRVVYRNEAGR